MGFSGLIFRYLNFYVRYFLKILHSKIFKLKIREFFIYIDLDTISSKNYQPRKIDTKKIYRISNLTIFEHDILNKLYRIHKL